MPGLLSSFPSPVALCKSLMRVMSIPQIAYSISLIWILVTGAPIL